MNRMLLSLPLLAYCAVACSYHKPSAVTSSAQSPPVETQPAEESAVYSAALTNLFSDGQARLLVIRNRTSFYDNPDYLKTTTADQRIQEMKRDFPAADESTIRDFDTKHLTSLEITSSFTLPVKYVVIKEDYSLATTNHHPERSFREFARRFPNASGIISLSRVGFSDAGNQALLGVDFACPLCGFEDHLLLKKESGKWVVVDKFVDWES